MQSRDRRFTVARVIRKGILIIIARRKKLLQLFFSSRISLDFFFSHIFFTRRLSLRNRLKTNRTAKLRRTALQSPICKIADTFLPFADRRRNDFFAVDRLNTSYFTPANSTITQSLTLALRAKMYLSAVACGSLCSIFIQLLMNI